MSEQSTSPTAPFVSEQSAAPRRRPGLLVEDRNACVRNNADGSQSITKVPSRSDEAARRGVDEASI